MEIKSLQLKKDSVFVCATDTLYGICASAFSKKAVERMYQIKGRDEGKPFIILIDSFSDLKKFNIILSSQQKKFLKQVWPNPVSVILPCPLKKFEYLHRGTKTLAFRMPALHTNKGEKKILKLLLKKFGPIVAPSANPQGKIPAESVEEAEKYFANQIDFYINEGKVKGTASTILSFVDNTPVVLRQGSYKISRSLHLK